MLLWFAGNASDDCVDEHGCYEDYHVHVRGCRMPSTFGLSNETINATDMRTDFLGDLAVTMSPTWDVDYCGRNFCSAGTCPEGYYTIYEYWYVGDLDAKRTSNELFLTALDQRLLNTTEHTTQQNSHERDVIMSMVASQITGVSTVYTTVCSGADQWKNSPHIGPVTRKMFPFEDGIMHVNSVLLEHHMMA